MQGGTRKAAIIAVIVVVAAVSVYVLFPYVASTKVSTLAPGETAYIYGTVEKRDATGGYAAFELNDGSGNVWVVWNGTLPAVGQKVLVHGTYQQTSLVVFNLDDFKASSVTAWPE